MIFAVALTLTASALAQDDRSVTSPDGRLSFRIFIGQPEPGGLSRLAYQVLFQGRRILETSYMGLEFLNQEPLLGENDGLIGSSAASDGAGYHALTVEYMQNGSIGRRINLEVRAYNDGVAFRYLLPRQTPLTELLLDDEATEFRFAQPVEIAGSVPLPLIVPQSGVGWVAIAEVRSNAYPSAHLERLDANTLVTRLSHLADDAELAYKGTTPLTCAWRVLIVGAGKDRLMQSGILQDLKR